MEKPAKQILLDAADFLENGGNWNKGDYFAFKDGGACMCVHGTISYFGSPEVKKLVDAGNASEANDITTIIAAGAVDQNWEQWYPSDMTGDLPLEDYIAKHYGQTGLAHYKAAQVGLTFGYNDDPDTTRQNIIDKLREAAT